MKKMTVYEIYLAICIETVDIWDNPRKRRQLAFVDYLDDYNHILEPYALSDTYPPDEKWDELISGLLFLVKQDFEIEPIVERAKEFAAHPEYFDAELNEQQRNNYNQKWDKSCIEYFTKGKK